MSAKVLVACAKCERKFTRYRCQARRVKTNYCSRACYHGSARVQKIRRLQDHTTGALTAALRAKGWSVRLVRIA